MQRSFTGRSGFVSVPAHSRYGSNYVSFQNRPHSRQASLPQVSGKGVGYKRLSRGAILADIFMVVIWGATIPGLMWLGAAGGF